MEEYVVVKTYSFSPETEATVFTEYRKAIAYLHWMWETCLNEEIANDSDLDKEWCYHEDSYGRIEWVDGDYMEFNLIEVNEPRKDFPTDWERYAM